MSGLAGAGKTWLILDLGIETARGGKWLGRFQCTKGTVVFIDEESRESLLNRRLSRMMLAKGLTPEETA